MRKIGVWGVLCVVLAACFPRPGKGGIEFRLRFPASSGARAQPSAYQAASFDATLSLTTVTVTVTQGERLITRVATGIGERALNIANLDPGRYDLLVEAQNGELTVLTGHRSGVVVEAGAMTDAGEIALAPHTPEAIRLSAPPPALTNVAALPLAGEKPTATGVRVNGVEAVGIDESTTFRTTLNLDEGANTVSLSAFNQDGVEGPSESFTVVLDTQAPVIKTFQIEQGLAAATSLSVTLQIDALEAAGMRICLRSDCADAPAWMPYATSTAFLLSAGSGSKTLYAQVRDEAGNASAIAGDSIALQLLTISSVSPRAVTSGSVISIAGTAFGAIQGVSSITLDGVTLPVLSWSDSAISVLLNGLLQPGPATLVLTVNGVIAPAVSIWLTPSAMGAMPPNGTVNTLVTLSGANFGPAVTTGSRVLFSGVPATVLLWSPTQIQAYVPTATPPGNLGIVVVAGGLASNPVSFTSTRPWIDNRYPRNVTTGGNVILTGRNFGTQYMVKVNGLVASIFSWSNTSINFYLPAGLPKGTLAVQVLATGSIPSNAVQITQRGSDVWMSLDDTPPAVGAAVGVWTGVELLVWGGDRFTLGESPGYSTRRGSRYNPATDTWISMSPLGAPTGRGDATAVWTGTEMIVWGGSNATQYFEDTGGRYNPLTDTWSPTGTLGVVGRTGHRAVWTGTEMLVFSGDYTNTGGRYNPLSDTWTATSTGAGVPSDRSDYTAVWTGNEMLVWGGLGADSTIRGDGSRYDPQTDTWSPLPAAGAPTARMTATAVWTGREMIVWGGVNAGALGDGGAYDAITNRWRPVSTGANAATPRYDHRAVWTGTEMLVFGGNAVTIGGRYDPQSDTWAPMSNVGALIDHEANVAVWTGSEALVWGGFDVGTWDIAYASGARYLPGTDAWSPMSSPAATLPSERGDHSAVWTGSEMIVWGGYSGSLDNTYLNTGGRYNPVTANWLPTDASVTAPTARRRHAGIWTGTHMLIWGGANASTPFNTGGLYDPATDSWQPTTTLWARPPRNYSGIVWTGTEMIMWGGFTGTSTYYNDGARYDPVQDVWNDTEPALGVPSGRKLPAAVWTGSRMLVWGGYGGSAVGDGASYDPVANTWTPISATNAPSARYDAYAVWDGTYMNIWGGGSGETSGARYYAAGDTWVTLATPPSARTSGRAVFTGNSIFVFGGLAAGQGSQDTLRYFPATNEWSPGSLTGFLPTSRHAHSVIWTGSEAIVWGGYYDGSRSAWQDGAIYLP